MSTKEELLATLAERLRALASSPPIPDPESNAASEQEAEDLALKAQNDLLLEQVRTAQLQNQSLSDDIKGRKGYATKLFCLIVAWLIGIFIVLLLSGFGGVCGHTFKLSDAVLLALIGSTTATVLGLFIVVVNYLFPQRKV